MSAANRTTRARLAGADRRADLYSSALSYLHRLAIRVPLGCVLVGELAAGVTLAAGAGPEWVIAAAGAGACVGLWFGTLASR